ncbi:putative lysophospholipase [Cryptosporidium felis]|nr:putative lysophospholipase [Cryptosporidium felis]
MEEFIREHSISPNSYCKEKKFTSTKFVSEKNGLRHCYHLFEVEPKSKRKGTTILIHGYSSHTLAEYMNVVKNEKLNFNNRQKKETKGKRMHEAFFSSELKKGENPFDSSQFVTSYRGSYIEYFNNKGYDVISLDLEGHGFSQGLKCNTEDLENNCYNIIQMLRIQMMKNTNQKEVENYQVSTYTWNSCERDSETGVTTVNKENSNWQSYLKTTTQKEIGNYSTKKCAHCSGMDCRFRDTFGDKILVCGISMGGAIAFRFGELIGETCEREQGGFSDKFFVKCLRSRMVCIVLLSPMLSLESVKKKPLNRLLLPLLPITSYLFPNLQVGSKAHNPASDHISSFSKNDPLYYGKRVKALMCRSLLNLTETIKDNLKFYPLDIPLLICHCVHDSMTDFEGSEMTIESLNRTLNKIKEEERNVVYSTSEFILWPITSNSMWHVLTRETGFQELLEKILNWVSNKEISHEKKCKDLNKVERNSDIFQPLFKSLNNQMFRQTQNQTTGIRVLIKNT